MKRVLLACALVARAAHADGIPADAQALFEQGITDMQAGKLDVACKELAASLAKYADSGTKGALASCYTKAGKIASAWTLWKELAETEADPAHKASAQQFADQLGPRLPRYKIQLAGAPAPGLIVTVNGSPVADPTLPTALPVDPGPLAITASAPGREGWSATLSATEAQTTTIAVPELAVTAAAARPHPPQMPIVEPVHSSRKLIAASIGAAGVVAVVAGAVFGSSASSTYDDAKQLCGGNIAACPTAKVSAAQSKVNDARTAANISTVTFGIGGVAIAAGAYLWLTAPSSESRVAVRPQIGPSSAGVVLSAIF